MLSLYDPFILFLFSSCRESFISLASEIEVDCFNYKTSCDGWFGCDFELYLWPHFGIGTRSVWLPSRFGFNTGLCLLLHFGIEIRSVWLHSSFSTTLWRVDLSYLKFTIVQGYSFSAYADCFSRRTRSNCSFLEIQSHSRASVILLSWTI